MTAAGWVGVGVAVAMAVVATAPASAAPRQQEREMRSADAVSAQARRQERRAPTRIEVHPLRRGEPLHRECVPVVTERWIPQWGGRVLYASQRCHWVRQ
jgi:hypothetical protein